jgi:hypothetical protein
MKTASQALSNELLKEANCLCFLVVFDVSVGAVPAIFRYTSLDVNIVYGGNIHYSRGMTFSGAEYSISPQVGKISFAIDNVDRAFSSLILNREVRGKRCDILLCALNWPATIIGVSTLFSGVIDGAGFDHQRASFDVFNPFVFWRRRVPRRIHQSTCPWEFAKIECTYVGIYETCDKSYEDCILRENTDNFGGFRFLPSMIQKKVSWGR